MKKMAITECEKTVVAAAKAAVDDYVR